MSCGTDSLMPLSQITLINDLPMENQGARLVPYSLLTLTVLAAGAPAVEAVARVRVPRWEAGGRRWKRRVRERLPAKWPGVGGGR